MGDFFASLLKFEQNRSDCAFAQTRLYACMRVSAGVQDERFFSNFVVKTTDFVPLLYYNMPVKSIKLHTIKQKGEIIL